MLMQVDTLLDPVLIYCYWETIGGGGTYLTGSCAYIYMHIMRTYVQYPVVGATLTRQKAITRQFGEPSNIDSSSTVTLTPPRIVSLYKSCGYILVLFSFTQLRNFGKCIYFF